MPQRTDPSIVTFASGVLSPKVLARSDIKQYAQGLRSADNAVILPHGAVTRRPGTYFVNEVKFSSGFTRLIPFQYSTEQTYMIEAGSGYFRFYANGSRVESPPGTPVEVATPWSDLQVGQLQWAQTADVMYIVHPDFMPRKLTRTSATSFSLDTVSFSLARAPILALNQDPSNFATITGAWPNLTVTMSQNTFVAGDVGRTFYVRSTVDKNAYYMTIVGYTSATVVTATGIDRFSSTAGPPSGDDADRWAFGAMDATHGCNAVVFHEGRLGYGGFSRAPDMIWLSVSDDFDNFELTSPDAATTDAENDDKAIQRRAINGQVNTVRWMASGGNSLIVGTSGAEFRLKPANDDILSPLSAALKRATQRGVSELPPAVIDNDIYYIDRSGAVLRRLKFDLLEDAERSTDASILAEHLLLPGVVDLAYQQSPLPTLWLVMADGGLVGWSIENDQEVLAAHPHHLGGYFGGGGAVVESVGVVPGANVAQTGYLEDQPWFIVKREIDGVQKRYIEFMVPYFRPNLGINPTDVEAVTATDRAFFVDCGLSLDNPIEISNITAAPAAVIISVGHGLVDGDIVRIRGMLADPTGSSMKDLFEQRRFIVAGATADAFTPVYTATAATVDTTGLRFIAPAYMYKEVPSVSGLGHLEGQTVAILTDGKVHPNKVVSGGAVTLDLTASLIHVGLPYTTAAQTMPISPGNQRGSDQGYQKQIGQTVASMMDTIGGEYGRGDNPTTWEPLVFESAGSPMDYGPRIKTGLRQLKFTGSPSEDLPTIHVRQRQPLPFTLLGLFPRLWSNAD